MAGDQQPPQSPTRTQSLRHAAIGVSFVAALFLAAAFLPPRDPLQFSTFVKCGAAVLVISFGFFFLLMRIDLDSPLVGAWLGTVVGTAIYLILDMCLYTAGLPENFGEWLLIVLFLVLSSTLLSFVGLAPAIVLGWLRKRHDVLSGILSGSVTGLALYAASAWSSPNGVLGIIAIASYGGWGAAMQSARGSKPYSRRDLLPEDVDEVACETVSRHPSLWKRMRVKLPFRPRKPIEPVTKWRRWWPY